MKKILIAILLLMPSLAFSQVKVIGPIVPNDPSDTYPTNYDTLQNGGYMSVQSIAVRNAIPELRRKEGMMVNVIDSNKRYVLAGGDWISDGLAMQQALDDSMQNIHGVVADSGQAMRDWVQANAPTFSNCRGADSATVPEENIYCYTATQAATSYDGFQISEGVLISVTSGDLASGEVKFMKDGDYWSKVIVPISLTNYYTKTQIDTAKNKADNAIDQIITPSLNLFDGTIQDDHYYSNTTGIEATDANYVNTTKITCSASTEYCIGGYGNALRVLCWTSSDVFIGELSVTSVSGGVKFTTPSNGAKLGFNLANNNPASGSFDNTFRMFAGATVFSWVSPEATTVYRIKEPAIDYLISTSLKDHVQLWDSSSMILLNTLVSSTPNAPSPIAGSSAGWKTAAYIPIRSAYPITISGWSSARGEIAFLDASFTNLQSGTVTKTDGTYTQVSPTGAAYLAMTIKSSTESDTMYQHLKVELGTTPTAGVAYSSSEINELSSFNNLPIASSSPTVPGARFAVRKSGNTLYVRTAFTNTTDIVNVLQLNNINGISNLGNCKVINKTDDISATGIYTALISDNTPPEQFVYYNNLGGNHGLVTIKATSTGHGKTSADVGSIWSDGTYQYYLAEVIDANNIRFLSKQVGSNDATYRITLNGSAPTLSHVSGATHTGSISVSSHTTSEVFPSAFNGSTVISLDGTVITANGDYSGNNLEVQDNFSIINPSTITVTSPFSSTNGDALADIKCAYRYGIRGSVSLDWVIDFKTDCTIRNLGFLQFATLSLTSSWTKRYFYFPQVLPVTVGLNTYDFADRQEMTTNAPAEIFLTPSEMADPDTPAELFTQYVTDASSVPKFGMAAVYNTDFGSPKPANRAANSEVVYINTINKIYPRVKGYNVASGTGIYYGTAAFCPYDPTTDTSMTIPYICFPYGAGYVVWLAAHSTLSKHTIKMDQALVGRSITVLRSNGNMTLLTNDVVPAAGLVINNTGHGYLCLTIK